MARWILLPKLGTNMESARVVRWLKAEGEAVEAGTPLVDVETDKATFTLESEAAGRLAAVQAREGDTVLVNDPVAAVLGPGEDGAGLVPPARAQQTGGDYLQRVRSAWRKAVPELGRAARLSMAPAARTLAREAGLSPEALEWIWNETRVLSAEELARLLDLPRAAIYGAGLGGKQILEVLRSRPQFLPVAFADDDRELAGTQVGGLPVLAGAEGLREKLRAGEIAAVFLSFHSEVRRPVYLRLKELGVPMPALVDGRAALGRGVVLGDGCLVEAGTVLGPATRVGENAIVDIGVVAAHDCTIGPHCHLSPGAHLSGAVELEENVLVGVGASLNSSVRVGRNSIIAPGSAVMNDVPPDVVVMGVPAAVVGESRRGA
jgi:sugar O-acyltransferase (sialic acid O-acetyltransferase NeuD family)